ncbi:MAG: YidH family protein [Pseudobdellovibrionaceae bacterium]
MTERPEPPKEKASEKSSLKCGELLDVPGFSQEFSDYIEEFDSDQAAEALSKHRMDLSVQQTKLSEKRTELSKKRTMMSDLNAHLSNERTYLSYLRTSLSLMTFGITVNRFSIYLQENNRVPKARLSLEDAEYTGIGMLLLGIVLLVISVFRYKRIQCDITEQIFSPPNKVVAILTAVIVTFAILGAVRLITTS